MPSVFTLEGPDLAVLDGDCPSCVPGGSGPCCGVCSLEGLCGAPAASPRAAYVSLGLTAVAVLGAAVAMALGAHGITSKD